MNVCPITVTQIDQRSAQGVALLVMLLVLAGMASSLFPVVFFLSFDFFSRGISRHKYSLLGLVSRQFVTLLGLTPRPVNAGPKIFAAKIGFAFCLLIMASEVFAFPDLGLVLAGVLALCAALEGFFSVCVGCYFYALLNGI